MISYFIVARDHLFSTFAKFQKNKHFLPPDTHKNVYVSGDTNVSVSKNFANVVN